MGHRRWLSLILLVALAACGGNKGVLKDGEISPEHLPALGSLASPSEIARSASFEDASQVRRGSEYEPAVPPARTLVDYNYPTYITLMPAVSPALEPAWVVYSFDLAGYDEEPLVNLTWSAKPLNSSVYLALANWGENHWDFVAVDPVSVTLPDLAPYISESGKTLVALVAVDSIPHQLRWLSIGDAPSPAAPHVFGVFPTSGQPGSALTLSGQFSGTQPLTYAWDFGGGADPSTSSEAKPTITLGAEGDYPATLTLSNKYGSTVHNFEIHAVMLSWTHHLVGDAGVNKFIDLDTTWQDHTLVAAEMDDGRVSLLEFDGDGNPLWNRAYSGLPANRVTELVVIRPEYIELVQETPRIEAEARETYLTCYQDDGGEPGNAYLLKLDDDGSVLWHRLLGQGIPDVCRSGENATVSLAMTSGHTLLARFDSTGDLISAEQTVEPANYYSCASGSGIDGSGLFLAGEVGGKPTVLRASLDEGWAFQFNFNGKITDCYNCEGGVAVTGTLESQPSGADTFFMDFRADGRLQGHIGLPTDPCRAVRLSGFGGIVMLTCSKFETDEAQVYVLDNMATLYRAVRIEGFGGILGGDFQYTRPRPPLPGEEESPLQPQESLIFCGAANVMNIAISQFTPTELGFWPEQMDVNRDFEMSSLPDNEVLEIAPEDISYTVDGPAGELDGLYVKMLGIY